MALNVTRQDSIDRMVETVVGQAGGIDVLVNNAGVFDMAPLLEITRESYRKTFAVNVEGLPFTLQVVARQMVKQGRGGKIVNFASQAGRRGEALVAVYCASKAAVISITQSAGLALARERVNVNGIAPGVVDTPMWDEVDALFAKYEKLPLGEKKKQVGLAVPCGRMGRPEDMTGMAVFLASSDADYIVAQTYNVDGGNWMSGTVATSAATGFPGPSARQARFCRVQNTSYCGAARLMGGVPGQRNAGNSLKARFRA